MSIHFEFASLLVLQKGTKASDLNFINVHTTYILVTKKRKVSSFLVKRFLFEHNFPKFMDIIV